MADKATYGYRNIFIRTATPISVCDRSRRLSSSRFDVNSTSSNEEDGRMLELGRSDVSECMSYSEEPLCLDNVECMWDEAHLLCYEPVVIQFDSDRPLKESEFALSPPISARSESAPSKKSVLLDAKFSFHAFYMNLQYKQLLLEAFIEAYVQNATSGTTMAMSVSLSIDGFEITKLDEWKASPSSLIRRRRLGHEDVADVRHIDQHLNLVSNWAVHFDVVCSDSVNGIADKDVDSLANDIYNSLSSKEFRDQFGLHVLGGVVDMSSVVVMSVLTNSPQLNTESGGESRRLLDSKQVRTQEESRPVSPPSSSLVILRTFCPWDFDKLITSFDDWVKFLPCDETNEKKSLLSKKPDVVLFFSGSFDQWGGIRVSVEKLVDDFNAGSFAWGHCFDKMYFDTANLSPSQDRSVFVYCVLCCVFLKCLFLFIVNDQNQVQP